MKRAYPQYMTAGGESLPIEILQVIYPLDYWPMIQTLASQHDLDPYLVAALVGQESTFDAGIVSSANAIGLDAGDAGQPGAITRRRLELRRSRPRD